MKRTGQRRPPRFARQGLLILLPVAVLAIFGLFSLRQDKLMVWREASEQAQAFANEFSDTLWARLTNPDADARLVTFTVNAAGDIIDPPPVTTVPSPEPLDLAALAPDQARLWKRANDALASTPGDASAGRAAQEFLASGPPDRFAAVIQFQVALSRATAGDRAAAVEAFHNFAERFPQVTGESGLPLAPLARLKAVELSDPKSRRAAAVELAEAVVSRPSSVTPILLRRLAEHPDLGEDIKPWQERWDRDSDRRRLVSLVRADLRSPPPAFWVTNHPDWKLEEHWLAVRSDSPANATRYHCWPQLDHLPSIIVDNAGRGSMSVVASLETAGSMASNLPPVLSEAAAAIPQPLVAALAKVQSHMPRYLGLTLEIAGRAVLSTNQLAGWKLESGGKGGGHYFKSRSMDTTPALLATAQRVELGHGEYARVGAYLTGPDLLYARQKSRTVLFGLLVVASAIAAVIGFVSARRAFLRQQALSEMKSNFVSSVSHELRAPIASVRLMAESLERGKIAEPARQGEYFRFITQECRRLSRLIDNVLDFARIEQGRKQYDLEPTDLRALIEQTVKLMEPAASEKQIQLDLALPDHAPSGNGLSPNIDGPAIQQALINLLDNAIKHSPIGGMVTVGWAKVDRAACPDEPSTPGHQPATVELWVEDHGPGIPPSEHERIFERFYRRGSEMRRETQGVGIGLSIVKHIVEAHGGRVRVESEVGRGSRFVIELPAGEIPGAKSK